MKEARGVTGHTPTRRDAGSNPAALSEAEGLTWEGFKRFEAACKAMRAQAESTRCTMEELARLASTDPTLNPETIVNTVQDFVRRSFVLRSDA